MERVDYMKKYYTKRLIAFFLIFSMTFGISILSIPIQAKENHVVPEYMKELSELVKETRDETDFGSIMLEIDNTEMSVDGQILKISENEEVAPSVDSGGNAEIPAEVFKDIDEEMLGSSVITSNELEENGYDVNYNKKTKEITITEPFGLKRIIVKTKNGKIKNTYGATDAISVSDNKTVLQYETKEDTKHAFEQYQKDKSVIYCAQDSLISIHDIMVTDTSVQNTDSEKYLSWGTTRVGADDYMANLPDASTLPEIVVAVIDSGADMEHPFIKDRLLDYGYDFYNNDSIPEDNHGHGTWCSGIIKEATKDNVKILPVKIFDYDDKIKDSVMAPTSVVLEAITYAVDNGANILSMSFGEFLKTETESYDMWNDVFEYVQSKNCMSFAASGNNCNFMDSLTEKKIASVPSMLPQVVSVGATDMKEMAADFQDFGSKLALTAPGVNITGAWCNGGYITGSGTSASAPLVAACAALLLSNDSCMTADEVCDELYERAGDKWLPGRDIYYGYGRVHIGEEVALEKMSFQYTDTQIKLSSALMVSPYGIDVSQEINMYPTDATNTAYTLYTNNRSILTFGDGIYRNYYGLWKVGTATIIAVTADKKIASSFVHKVLEDSEYDEQTFKEPLEVTLNKKSLTLYEGEEFKLSAINKPYYKRYEKNHIWTSSNLDVAFVDSEGNVTAMNEGTATIKAAIGIVDMFDTCSVTVKKGQRPQVKLKTLPNKTEYFVGETLDTTGMSLEITYSNGETKTVNEGFICTPTVLESYGTQTIIVEYDGLTTAFNVAVNKKDTTVTGIELPDKLTLNFNESFILTGTIIPHNATNKNIIWSTSDKNVATVDENGKVTAVGKGTAVITATTEDGGFTAECEVTVKYSWWQWIIVILLFGWIWY